MHKCSHSTALSAYLWRFVGRNILQSHQKSHISRSIQQTWSLHFVRLHRFVAVRALKNRQYNPAMVGRMWEWHNNTAVHRKTEEDCNQCVSQLVHHPRLSAAGAIHHVFGQFVEITLHRQSDDWRPIEIHAGRNEHEMDVVGFIQWKFQKSGHPYRTTFSIARVIRIFSAIRSMVAKWVNAWQFNKITITRSTTAKCWRVTIR